MTASRKARGTCLAAVLVTAMLCGLGTAWAAEKAPLKSAAAPAKTALVKPAPVKAAPEAVDKPAESDVPDEGVKSDSKGPALPIPRFVSLRTDPINLRAGPGVRYPVDWVYVRRHLPVEVIGEFDTWRRIRDPDGAEGWVHQSMLSGKRTGIITGGARSLMRSNDDKDQVVTILEPGVVVNVQRCPADTTSCRVEVNGLQGWLPRDQFWGVYPSENVQ